MSERNHHDNAEWAMRSLHWFNDYLSHQLYRSDDMLLFGMGHGEGRGAGGHAPPPDFYQEIKFFK